MEFLQVAWFVLIFVLLTGYALLDGFDLGVGFWNIFAKDKKEKQMMLDTIGPFWDGNEVWLLTGGGAIFAAFPPVYATTFSAFYLAMILVVFSLIFRALSIEFRDKIESDSWYKIWDCCFTIGSALAAILFGVAVGNIIKGLPLDSNGNYIGWFFDHLRFYPILIGLTTLAMFVFHGATYLKMKLGDEMGAKLTGWVGELQRYLLQTWNSWPSWFQTETPW
jgi:cytochrome d ubiquinol oxidase subunit II